MKKEYKIIKEINQERTIANLRILWPDHEAKDYLDMNVGLSNLT
jgi:hypothetical protein